VLVRFNHVGCLTASIAIRRRPFVEDGAHSLSVEAALKSECTSIQMPRELLLNRPAPKGVISRFLQTGLRQWWPNYKRSAKIRGNSPQPD
jgi:hypothetical protein